MTTDTDAASEAPADTPAATPAATALKSKGGLGRLVKAARYSFFGLRAALRHEAAFRQEVAMGLPLLLLVPWIAPGRWQALCMAGSVVAVWVVELLNSAVEALADAVTLDRHPLLGRAKDIGSAAVLLSLTFAVVVWVVALWP